MKRSSSSMSALTTLDAEGCQRDVEFHRGIRLIDKPILSYYTVNSYNNKIDMYIDIFIFSFVHVQVVSLYV